VRRDSLRYFRRSLVLFLLGSLIQGLSYGSYEPLPQGMALLGLGVLLLSLTPLGGTHEQGIFRLTFSVCWVAAGVAAVYANQLDDTSQIIFSDAWSYYTLASNDLQLPPPLELLGMVDAAGAIYAWRAVYNLFDILGFERAPYVGIGLNVFVMALTAVLSVKAVKLIFGNDDSRLRRFTTLFAFSGIFWLFASIHLRDSMVALVLMALGLAWMYLSAANVTLYRLVIAILVSVVTASILAILRPEFAFAPLATYLAASVAMSLEAKARRQRRLRILMSAIVLLVVAGLFFGNAGADLLSTVIRGRQEYQRLTQSQVATGSLGLLIVDAPLPVRLVLGSAWLLVYPIPVWVELRELSAYHLFKALNGLFMYGVMPLVMLGVGRIITRRSLRTAPLMFVLFMAIGLTLIIAATSLESRHVGSFLPFILVLAVVPDLTATADQGAYGALLGLMLASLVVVHVLWVVLKLL